MIIIQNSSLEYVKIQNKTVYNCTAKKQYRKKVEIPFPMRKVKRQTSVMHSEQDLNIESLIRAIDHSITATSIKTSFKFHYIYRCYFCIANTKVFSYCQCSNDGAM